MHMKPRFEKDAIVPAGEPLWDIGETGRATGPHAHIAVTSDVEPTWIPKRYWQRPPGSTQFFIDPMYFLTQIAPEHEP